MNEKALKIVNSLITSDLIQTAVNKTGIEQKTVVQIAIELSGKLVTDETCISKNKLEDTIKNLIQNDELRAFLEVIENKYNIPKSKSSGVLSELLPSVFRNFMKLDQSFFEESKEEIHQAIIEEKEPIVDEKPIIEEVEEPKKEIIVEKEIIEEQREEPIVVEEIEQSKEELVVEEPKKESSIDDVFENIEKKAVEDCPAIKKEKKKAFLFKPIIKKERHISQKEEKEYIEEVKENTNLSIIDTICMIAIAAVFVALVAIVIYLFLKQKV